MSPPTLRSAAHRLRGLLRRDRDVSEGSGAQGRDPGDFLASLTPEERELVARALPITITSPERLVAASDAVRHVVRRAVPGALVECGVWKGGSVLAMILALQHLGVSDRDIYLYDTFEGMTEPGEVDTSPYDEPALDIWRRAQAAGERPWPWFFNETFTLEQVQTVLWDTGYPRERLHFVVGRVEDTIPAQAPEQVALLRLDTDWYDSTRHELVHLYPRVSTGGVLIVDDYGHWDGCRKAVDEFFAQDTEPLLLHRIDYTGRIAVKV